MQTVLISAANVIFALLVFYWSGSLTEKTIYDRYIVQFESASVPVRDLEAAAAFYTDVLSFFPLPVSELDEEAGLRGFSLPEKRRIFLELRRNSAVADSRQPDPDAALIIIRVRNGIDKLHRELVRRSEQPAYSVDPARYLAETLPGRVTELFRGERGRQFVVSDPDNNQILFYSPRKLFQ